MKPARRVSSVNTEAPILWVTALLLVAACGSPIRSLVHNAGSASTSDSAAIVTATGAPTPSRPGPATVVEDATCIPCSAEWSAKSVVGAKPRAFARGAPDVLAQAQRLYSVASRNVRSGTWHELRHPACGWAYTGALASKFAPGRGVVLDEQGKVRVYLEEGGGEEHVHFARIFFDETGRHRFVFLQISSMYFGAWESLFVFGEEGDLVVSKEREGFNEQQSVLRWVDELTPNALLRETCPSPCPSCK